MARAKQLTISHENRPGMVAEIAKVLGDAKVNILSCLTTTSGTEGVTQVVVDKVNKAEKALANAGLSFTEADVLSVELPNTPGALEKFARKLAEKNINITMGYATGGEGSRKTTVVLAVSDLDKAAGIR
jgi:hypothetical protein